MNIENEQLQEYINNLNNYTNKENITLKNQPEISRKELLKKYGKDYHYKLELNLDLKTTPFNQFLKDNKVLDRYYEKYKSYYSLPKSLNENYPKSLYLFDKLIDSRIVPGKGYKNKVVFGSKFNPNFNNEDDFFNFINKIDFNNNNTKINNEDYFLTLIIK
jgi:hypothetical protein